MPKHYFEPMTKTPKPRSQTVNAPKAFPPDRVEPRGATRFGPPVQPERKTVENVHNVDPHGTAKPWEK